MLKYIVLALVGLYLFALVILAFCKQKQPKTMGPENKALLIIQKEVTEKNLEWLVYSFNSFAAKNLADYTICLCLIQEDKNSQKGKTLAVLCQRFNFKFVAEPFNPKEYKLIFFCSNNTVSNYWLRELHQSLPKAN